MIVATATVAKENGTLRLILPVKKELAKDAARKRTSIPIPPVTTRVPSRPVTQGAQKQSLRRPRTRPTMAPSLKSKNKHQVRDLTCEAHLCRIGYLYAEDQKDVNGI